MNLFIPGNAGDKIIKIDIEKKLELNINEKTAVTFNLSLPEKYRDYLYFLPAPLSGIFWLIGLIP